MAYLDPSIVELYVKAIAMSYGYCSDGFGAEYIEAWREHVKNNPKRVSIRGLLPNEDHAKGIHPDPKNQEIRC
jgi:hypothetical protein